MTSLWQFYWPTQWNFRIRAPSAGGVKQLQLLNRWVLQEKFVSSGVDNLSGFSCLWLSPVCQTVQEEGAGESGGALRLQRLRLPDGDDRPRQTAQLHRRRSESRDSCFSIVRSFTALFAERCAFFTAAWGRKKKKRKQALPVGRGLLCFRPASDGNPLLSWTLKPREVQSGFVCVCASKRFLLYTCLSSTGSNFLRGPSVRRVQAGRERDCVVCERTAHPVCHHVNPSPRETGHCRFFASQFQSGLEIKIILPVHQTVTRCEMTLARSTKQPPAF